MHPQTLSNPVDNQIEIKPPCSYFGTCGGCAYQNISYERELAVKEGELRALLSAKFQLKDEVFDPIVPSPEEYHYRNRLDLSFRKTRIGEHLLGFKPEGGRYIIQIDSCPIARKEISDFIPKLKSELIQKLPEKYNMANVTIRTDASGRVFWGGIGRRSLEMFPKDYFWIEILGRRIFYSLDTFFQANPSILPLFVERLRSFPLWDERTAFFDLYAGVGLFGIALYDRVGKVVMVEESGTSIQLARYNAAYHGLDQVKIYEGKVESKFPELLRLSEEKRHIALVDPPRKGLSQTARITLAEARRLEAMLCLSCNPAALAEDMSHFVKKGWKIEKVMPFDFFPKTKHLETLVWLRP